MDAQITRVAELLHKAAETHHRVCRIVDGADVGQPIAQLTDARTALLLRHLPYLDSNALSSAPAGSDALAPAVGCGPAQLAAAAPADEQAA